MARAANGTYYKNLKEMNLLIMYDNNGRYPIFMDMSDGWELLFLKEQLMLILFNKELQESGKQSQDKKELYKIC